MCHLFHSSILGNYSHLMDRFAKSEFVPTRLVPVPSSPAVRGGGRGVFCEVWRCVPLRCCFVSSY